MGGTGGTSAGQATGTGGSTGPTGSGSGSSGTGTGASGQGTNSGSNLLDAVKSGLLGTSPPPVGGGITGDLQSAIHFLYCCRWERS